MAVCSPVRVNEWFSIKKLFITTGTGLYLLSVIEVWVTNRHRQIGKRVAQNYQYVCLQYRYLYIYLSIFVVTYMTYERLIKCEVVPVGIAYFTTVSSWFCFLNYLAVAKKLKTICQLTKCQDLVE